MKQLIAIVALFAGVITMNAAETNPMRIAQKFLIQHEGTVKVNGVHVLYDDKQPTYINGKFNVNKVIKAGETYEQFKARCKGTPTIGYGETSELACKMLRMPERTAQYFLLKSIRKVYQYMPKKFGNAWYNLNNNQKAALTCYFYNCGMYSKHPSMLKLMKTQPELCYQQMDAGVKTAKALGLSGLLSRRAAEVALFKA